MLGVCLLFVGIVLINNGMCTLYKVDGKSITGYMVGESITISEDGKFSSTASSIGNGTWELNGNKMSAKNTYGDTFSATIVVSGNKMKWNGTSSLDVSFNYTWEKK